ncbi:uncharacterized protein LOC124164037 isoform X2 [Ischnura elegans]|uniref:uncharacterized protein LOC124164037 isoform X2 n=1 Tax=Ischnura elegans TaxID=197161 RepID=UPI001ED86D97|nr:uncharacterized protein LOC124164037 isoform X2 [Ischnura elegans]
MQGSGGVAGIGGGGGNRERGATLPRANAGRYVHSVSDLYGADEIEDFEIDGSRSGGVEKAGTGAQGLAGVNQGVEDGDVGANTGDRCESLGTIGSWDSHTNYQQVYGLEDGSDGGGAPFPGVVLFCDESHLKSPTGIVRVLLVISSVACLACLCSSGGGGGGGGGAGSAGASGGGPGAGAGGRGGAAAAAAGGLFLLPLPGRLRLMLFVTVFSILATCLLLFLDISHLVYLFPFNWSRLNGWFFVLVSVAYLVSSSLLLHLVHIYLVSYGWVSKHTRDQLIVTGALGYVCALEALLLAVLSRCDQPRYAPVEEERTALRGISHEEEEEEEMEVVVGVEDEEAAADKEVAGIVRAAAAAGRGKSPRGGGDDSAGGGGSSVGQSGSGGGVRRGKRRKEDSSGMSGRTSQTPVSVESPVAGPSHSRWTDREPRAGSSKHSDEAALYEAGTTDR